VPAQARDGAARAGHRERDAMGRGVALEPTAASGLRPLAAPSSMRPSAAAQRER
jgi:hypothetical protein